MGRQRFSPKFTHNLSKFLDIMQRYAGSKLSFLGTHVLTFDIKSVSLFFHLNTVRSLLSFQLHEN
jgi:hypothetical protein